MGVRGRRKFILCFHFVLGWGGSEEWVGVVVMMGGLVGWKSEDHVR